MRMDQSKLLRKVWDMLKNKMDVNLKEDSGTKLTQQRFLRPLGRAE